MQSSAISMIREGRDSVWRSWREKARFSNFLHCLDKSFCFRRKQMICQGSAESSRSVFSEGPGKTSRLWPRPHDEKKTLKKLNQGRQNMHARNFHPPPVDTTVFIPEVSVSPQILKTSHCCRNKHRRYDNGDARMRSTADRTACAASLRMPSWDNIRSTLSIANAGPSTHILANFCNERKITLHHQSMGL